MVWAIALKTQALSEESAICWVEERVTSSNLTAWGLFFSWLMVWAIAFKAETLSEELGICWAELRTCSSNLTA